MYLFCCTVELHRDTLSTEIRSPINRPTPDKPSIVGYNQIPRFDPPSGCVPSAKFPESSEFPEIRSPGGGVVEGGGGVMVKPVRSWSNSASPAESNLVLVESS